MGVNLIAEKVRFDLRWTRCANCGYFRNRTAEGRLESCGKCGFELPAPLWSPDTYRADSKTHKLAKRWSGAFWRDARWYYLSLPDRALLRIQDGASTVGEVAHGLKDAPLPQVRGALEILTAIGALARDGEHYRIAAPPS